MKRIFLKLTVWLIPHMKTLIKGSLALKSFTFCWTVFIFNCFLFALAMVRQATGGKDIIIINDNTVGPRTKSLVVQEKKQPLKWRKCNIVVWLIHRQPWWRKKKFKCIFLTEISTHFLLNAENNACVAM